MLGQENRIDNYVWMREWNSRIIWQSEANGQVMCWSSESLGLGAQAHWGQAVQDLCPRLSDFLSRGFQKQPKAVTKKACEPLGT